ncbi:MAG: ParB/RepB/Spo0J family partition protein [bacterium]|nr:ParB/RepB/Spo0J family partition protein [bacterium]
MNENSSQFLDIDIIQPNPLQPRGLITPESLIEIVDSIREHGVLEPLVVAKTPAGYQIIAGERRWRAGKIAGLTQIPVIIRETSPQGMLEMAIVENAQRIDLNPLERAQAFRRLQDEFGLTTGEIAQRIGKSPSFVSNTLRLLSTPDVLKDGLLSGATTEGHVRALMTLEDPVLVLEAYKEVLKRNLSVRGAEEVARRLKNRMGMVPSTNESDGRVQRMRIVSEEIDEMQKNLQTSLHQETEKLGVKTTVDVTQSRVRARLILTFSGNIGATSGILRKLTDTLSAGVEFEPPRVPEDQTQESASTAAATAQ